MINEKKNTWVTWTLLIIGVLTFVACADGKYDNKPPTVLEVAPVPEATVPSIVPLRVIFSEAVSPGSLDASAFTLEADSGGMVAGSLKHEDGSLTVAYFHPETPLAADESYTATVTTHVADLTGNFLSEPYVWSFRTTVSFEPPEPPF